MFVGDSADTCAVKFPLVSMGGRAEGLACADPGARTHIGVSGNYQPEYFFMVLNTLDSLAFLLYNLVYGRNSLTYSGRQTIYNNINKEKSKQRRPSNTRKVLGREFGKLNL